MQITYIWIREVNFPTVKDQLIRYFSSLDSEAGILSSGSEVFLKLFDFFVYSFVSYRCLWLPTVDNSRDIIRNFTQSIFVW